MKDQRSHSDHDHSPSDDGDPTPEQIERWRQLDAEAANKGLREIQALIAEVRRDMAAAGITGPHLISVDELRAAGALDVPPEWRKSLGTSSPKRDLFSDLPDDDDQLLAEHPPTRIDPGHGSGPAERQGSTTAASR